MRSCDLAVVSLTVAFDLLFEYSCPQDTAGSTKELLYWGNSLAHDYYAGGGSIKRSGVDGKATADRAANGIWRMAYGLQKESSRRVFEIR